jgi:catechol-2,3-dioxygenase
MLSAQDVKECVSHAPKAVFARIRRDAAVESVALTIFRVLSTKVWYSQVIGLDGIGELRSGEMKEMAET